VEARVRVVESYLSAAGKDYFRQWLRRIRDPQAKQAIQIRINRVMMGNFGDSRPVGNGVHELRIDVGQGYRVYYAEDGDKVILLGGSAKADQDTQIKAAKLCWNDYNA
jgi:putative addiction module killer protein